MNNQKLAYINGVILSGEEDMRPVTGKTLITEGGRIAAIRDAGADLTGCQVIDLNGAYLMPGLINMHVHIPGSGKPKKKQTDEEDRASGHGQRRDARRKLPDVRRLRKDGADERRDHPALRGRHPGLRLPPA